MRNATLSQFFTPTWAAEHFVSLYRDSMRAGRDVVWEPACGDGRFLMSIPEDVRAYGCEIDPVLADQARANSGREVLCGDFLSTEMPEAPTLILGNPPFKSQFLEGLLDRAADVLPEGGLVGLLLPVYMFQTANTVMRFSRQFSIRHELVPRNIFQGMEKPLMWAHFERTKTPVLSGFMLYGELAALESVKRKYKTLFVGNESRASLWGELVEQALITLGGSATLEEIYAEVEGKRPTDNPWWRPQIRKIARKNYRRVAKATYELEAA